MSVVGGASKRSNIGGKHDLLFNEKVRERTGSLADKHFNRA
jgi:hypothetical protein